MFCFFCERGHPAVTFQHHQAEPTPKAMLMSGHTFKDAPCFLRLPGLNPTPHLTWNMYIGAIPKYSERKYQFH